MEIILRKPNKNDSKNIFRLVENVKTLDVNSQYLYLLQATHFRDSCCIASYKDEIIGFVSGYILPKEKDKLFIWQVAVDSRFRGKSLAKKIMMEILSREEMSGIKYIYSTVSPSNIASQRVFEKTAKELETVLETESFFEIEDFIDAHESEVLYKIGPITNEEGK